MDQVEEVKSKTDIVDVVSTYVPLKKAGRNLSGLCPFHGEKTPSFMVSPERQVFKCFGCGEGGDVISFLEKIEGWEFREALEELAKRAGIKLKSLGGNRQNKQKDKILEINKTAAKFFSYLLLEHKSGEAVRNYLKNRGIKKSIWVKFGLGFAPDSWDSTLSMLKKKGFTGSDIVASGLVVSRQGKESGFYDRFRGRLMFPIFDSRGNVLGFSGRTIAGDEKGAKYINSPETGVFSKGSVLFGYFQTKDAIRDKNEAILVEGEFDMLSLYQAGFKNVVASKGTALTEAQVKILARSGEGVILCFDSDLAGDKAARRGIEMLEASGLIIKTVKLQKYKDPDEFAQRDPEGFGKALKNASNFYDFLIDSAALRYDSSTVYGKKKIGQEILPVLSKISDDVVKAHYLGKVSQLLGVDSNLLAQNIEAKNTNINVSELASGQKRLDERSKLEHYFLALYLIGDSTNSDFFKILEAGDFSDSESRQFWKSLHDIITSSKSLSKRKLLESLPRGFKDFVDSLYLLEVDAEFLDAEERAVEMLKVAERIKKLSVKNRLVEMSSKIKEAENNGDWKTVSILTKRFGELSQTLKKE